MGTSRFDHEALFNLIYERRVVTKPEMLRAMGCSTMSLWRALTARGYLTSFNFNAGYYTLRDVAEFDEDGLWFHKSVGFSVHGTLTETVRVLTVASEAGLTGAQVRQRLTVNAAPTLRRLWRSGDLFREKHGDVQVYFAIDPIRRRAQVSARCVRMPGLPAGGPQAEVVVAILVELIQRVELTPAEVRSRLSVRGVKVAASDVRRVFEHYDLGSGKKGLSNW